MEKERGGQSPGEGAVPVPLFLPHPTGLSQASSHRHEALLRVRLCVPPSWVLSVPGKGGEPSGGDVA